MVSSPHLSDLVTFHQAEARGVYVGELGATEAVKHSQGLSVVVHVHVEDAKTIEVVEESSEGSSRLLSVPVEKPRVGLGHNEKRCAPACLSQGEECSSLVVPLIACVQKLRDAWSWNARPTSRCWPQWKSFAARPPFTPLMVSSTLSSIGCEKFQIAPGYFSTARFIAAMSSSLSPWNTGRH